MSATEILPTLQMSARYFRNKVFLLHDDKIVNVLEKQGLHEFNGPHYKPTQQQLVSEQEITTRLASCAIHHDQRVARASNRNAYNQLLLISNTEQMWCLWVVLCDGVIYDIDKYRVVNEHRQSFTDEQDYATSCLAFNFDSFLQL